MTARRWDDTVDWCPACGASICLKVDGRFYAHGPRADRCPGSNQVAPIVEPRTWGRRR